jgi:phosphoribosylanthranilate isomerase
MHRTRIKICGLTREADVDAAVGAGADAIGFVLYAKSARAVSVARAAALAQRLPPFVTPVLLFVNEAPDAVRAALAKVPGALAQFHGDETPDDCERSVSSPGEGRGPATARWIRAARLPFGGTSAGGVEVSGTTDDPLGLVDFALRFRRAQALLLDAHVEGYGGAGKVFDWSLVPARVPARLVLSGGLHAANVGQGMALLRPWAVDVSSGVEASKGVKDAGLMRRFCEAVREADERLEAVHPANPNS